MDNLPFLPLFLSFFFFLLYWHRKIGGIAIVKALWHLKKASFPTLSHLRTFEASKDSRGIFPCGERIWDRNPILRLLFGQDLHWGKTNFSQKEFPVGTGVLASPPHMAPCIDRHWTARRMEYKEVRIDLAMENSSEESGDCESVQNPLGEDCVMKGPQLTKQYHGCMGPSV